MPRPRSCLLALACSALLLSAVVGGEDAKTAAPMKTAAEIERLIEQLGSDQFGEREAASKALEAIGEPALDALRKAATGSSDAEIRQRAEDLVKARDARVYREVRCFKGHDDFVYAVAFSPDGKRVLSGSHDQTVRLWDAETGKELRRFTGHRNPVYGVAFSPDGKRALLGGADCTLRLWDVETGKELRRFMGHGGFIMSVAFSPDGKQALSGSVDRTVRLWDAETGRELHCFKGHTDDVESVAFSPDGKRALSGGDKTLRLWRLAAEAGGPAGQPADSGSPKRK